MSLSLSIFVSHPLTVSVAPPPPGDVRRAAVREHRASDCGGPREQRSTQPLPPEPLILDPKLCILHPTPYTLHPTPYTLHPTPYTLHPQRSTLNPTP